MFEWLYSVLMSIVTWVLSFFGSNVNKSNVEMNNTEVSSEVTHVVQDVQSETLGTKVEVEAFNEDNEFTKPTQLP
jgi:hypothetical protein